MGCVNESGCLGPKRRERDVYAQLIDSIHHEAKKIQFGNTLNIYSSIQQRLGKKGFIRKLLDNLTSHRSNISEALSHNLSLTTQNSGIQNKYAGLIILNQIVNNLYQDKQTAETPFSDQRTYHKTNSSKSKLVPQQHSATKPLSHDGRADLHFFWLILHLLQNQARIYPNILESIRMFCAGRREPIANRAEVWRVLDKLLLKVQRNLQAEEGAAAYLYLIERLKQTGQQEGSEEKSFLALVRLWLGKRSEGMIDEASQASLELKYEQIIKVFIGRSISSSAPNSIYRILFTIYDEENFHGSRVFDSQILLFRLMQESDLHSSVLRGVFLYMLQYLSASPKYRSSNWKTSGAEEFNVGRYPHLMDRQCRLRAFETLRRWGEKGFFSLHEYVSFSTTTLVHVYTANLGGQKQFSQQVMRQFLRITEQFKPQLTMSLVSLLMEQIKFQTGDQSLRQALVVLVREVIQTRQLMFGVPQDHFQYFIPLDQALSRDTTLEIIQLMAFIAKQIPPNLFTVNTPQNNPFIQSLCRFLHSIFEVILVGEGKPRGNRSQEDDQILYKYQLSNSTISFLKCLTEKNAYSIFLAFLASLIESLPECINTGTTNTYFLLYTIFEGLHAINTKQKVPDKMAALNFRLAPSLRSADIQPEIDKTVEGLVGRRGQLAKKSAIGILATLNQLRESCSISQQEFRQGCSHFGDEFGQLKAKGKGGAFQENTLNYFKRQSLPGSGMGSSGGSRLEEDQSFKDVLDRIHGV